MIRGQGITSSPFHSITNLTMNRFRIKDLAEEERPREKFLLKGVASLSDAELLAILIGSGNQSETAVELSRRILKSVHDNLNELGKYDIKQLTSLFKGIGEVKAITIMAALELGKRRKLSEIIQRKKITNSEDVFQIFHPMFMDLPYEEFWILLLSRSNQVIEKIKISQGGVSETAVDIKLILKKALLALASGMILCHNHPSGNKKPSKTDDLLTGKIKEGAKLFDIAVLDHIIVCGDTYYSYGDEGRI